jgi:FtsP/CotA-like multicopper oxidase with cupredoxin domain
MDNKKQIYAWIIVGVIVALVVIYFAVKGGGIVPSGNQSGQTSGMQTASGTVAAPGASPVTNNGEVLAPSGQVANNAAVPGSETAPSQSAPVASSSIPASAIKLNVSTAGGFVPSTFTVKAGAAVTLSLTATDDQTHVLRFDDSSLQAVAIGIGPGMTRVITFNAPTTAGTYSFHDDVPGHTAAGVVGKMIVQ